MGRYSRCALKVEGGRGGEKEVVCDRSEISSPSLLRIFFLVNSRGRERFLNSLPRN